jgi:two-component system, chemotaxis family, chemotaxis protein CheY
MPGKILVVDDNADHRELIVIMLETEGYAVSTASDGREGLEQVKTNRPDLIICDVMMPGIDGIQMVKMIRQMPEHSGIPILMITAHGDVRANAIEAGANRTLGKPFDLEDLINLSREMLSTGSDG